MYKFNCILSNSVRSACQQVAGSVNAGGSIHLPPMPGQDSVLRWAGKKYEELPIAHIKATYNNTHVQVIYFNLSPSSTHVQVIYFNLSPSSTHVQVIYFNLSPSSTHVQVIYFNLSPSSTHVQVIYFNLSPSSTHVQVIYFNLSPSSTHVQVIYFNLSPSSTHVQVIYFNLSPSSTHVQVIYFNLSPSSTHVQVIYFNLSPSSTHVQVTDSEGQFMVRTSCGTEGFKNVKKSTPIAAQTAGISAAAKATVVGVTFVRVLVKGLGPGRLSAIKGLTMGGLKVVSITDNTPVPHNGCRPRKARRI
ncbi:28S ribosomal protein S11, mitochondrial isoform X2 [Salvelinus fontinalis]|uniref:28S ribosomal protein S11, mitochondrial isoform X2 n=1 Tax=Salvelinus fontinalis TaxID=8038 RepID=UPI002485F8E2|nr:28S ribosomal protein S11, mitochondrial isoform X2 [Salvelinus fontinalis]